MKHILRSTIRNLVYYIKLKTGFSLEYLETIKNMQNRSAMCKLRISAHILQIEMGGYSNVSVTDRKCPVSAKTSR